MAVSLQDFFSPDPNASNRQLKKFLEGEGIGVSYREVVALRALARKGLLVSYALLESLTDGEGSGPLLDALERLEVPPTSRQQSTGFRVGKHSSGLTLAGLPEEFPQSIEDEAARRDQDREPRSLEAQGSKCLDLVPSGSAPRAVLGPTGITVGGSWPEETLHQDSVTLLDGEDDVALVEAFRHLYRAAPDPASRTSVLGIALKRRKRALSSEVADKLQELSVPLGRSLRQLLCGQDYDERARALKFLLAQEYAEHPDSWVEFWRRLRTAVLETLAQEKDGSTLLLDSVVELHTAASQSASPPLTPPLLEALLSQPEQLAPNESRAVIGLLLLSLERTPESVRLLQNRLELSDRLPERLLIGETLRQYFERTEAHEPLRELMERFAKEALKVGSTASSLALSELLVAFGEELLTLESLTELRGLPPRQLLRVVELWDQLAQELPGTRPLISRLFLKALEDEAVDRSLLLKSRLLECPEHLQALDEWCRKATPESRRELFAAGTNWTLSTVNREHLSRVLRGRDWFAEELWRQEWRRANLSFQRLGWLAQCSIPLPGASTRQEARRPEWTQEMEQRLFEVLDGAPRNPYFWDLMGRLATMGCWSDGLVELCVATARRLANQGETSLDEERPVLVQAAAATLGYHRSGEELQDQWQKDFDLGEELDLLWQFELVEEVFRLPLPDLQADPALPAAILQKLFRGGQLSMDRVLARALTGEEDSELRRRLTLEELNRGLSALASISDHHGTKAELRSMLQRRLAMFLQSWAEQLASSTDLYAFRSTPLFTLLIPHIETERSPLQELIDRAVLTLWNLQRQQPEKLRLDIRQSAQDFLKRWLERRDPARFPITIFWQRTLDDLHSRS